MSGRRRIFVIIAAVLLAVFIYVGFVATPPAPRDVRAFDPDRTASIEVDMWKAYYDQRAASTFASIRTSYEQVLPDLEDGYRVARDWSGLTYEPAAIARAELAWWVARRIPGKDSPEQVGALIADLNAQFYGMPREKVLEGSILRARAGRLESYRSLHKGLN